MMPRAAFAHTPFRGNDETPQRTDSLLMAHHTFITAAARLPQWLHRLQVQLRWMRADTMNRLPLLRLAAAVLVALLALATASGVIGA